MGVLQNYLSDLEQLRDEKEFALVKLRNEIANIKADIRKTKKRIEDGRDYDKAATLPAPASKNNKPEFDYGWGPGILMTHAQYLLDGGRLSEREWLIQGTPKGPHRQ